MGIARCHPANDGQFDCLYACFWTPSLPQKILRVTFCCVLPGFSPISVATSRGLWEWCGFRGFHLAVGIIGFSISFIGSSSFFFVFGTDVVFLTRSATSRPQPTTLDRLREERQRRCTVDMIRRLKMKGFSRISL
jgi:hypothetical protein